MNYESTLHYDLPPSVENLEIVVGRGTPAHRIINGVGNELDNHMTGSDLREGLDGSDGNDVLYGLGGHDLLRGRQGDDTLFGGSGNDQLAGYADDDLLRGGPGNDHVFGGNGSDEMWGGQGEDTFSISGSGVDQLKDYVDGVDHILLFQALLVSTPDYIDLFEPEPEPDLGTVANYVLRPERFHTGDGVQGAGAGAPAGIYVDTATDEVYYNSGPGPLSWLIAQFEPGVAATLDASDFGYNSAIGES